jgi:hypothetical protein
MKNESFRPMPIAHASAGVDGYAATLAFPSICAREGDGPSEEQGALDEFVVKVQHHRTLLHRLGCEIAAGNDANECPKIFFKTSHAAREWLRMLKRPWQNCRACGGAKPNKSPLQSRTFAGAESRMPSG